MQTGLPNLLQLDFRVFPLHARESRVIIDLPERRSFGEDETTCYERARVSVMTFPVPHGIFENNAASGFCIPIST